MTSFDAATFKELLPDDAPKVWSKAGNVVTKKIPGSDDNVLQKIGVGLPRLAIPAQMTAAQLTSMRSKVGTEASLIFTYETVTARLESMDTPVRASIHADLYETQLHFIRSSGAISGTPSTAILTEAGETLITEASDPIVTE